MIMAIHKTTAKANDDAIKMEVIEKCGVLGKRGKSTLELRYVAWNGREAKYDIRPWGTDEEGNETCFKGITLSGEELEALGEVLDKMRGKTTAKGKTKA